MRLAVFSTKPYDEHSFLEVNAEFRHELAFFEERLKPLTAQLAEGFPAVCAFVNDDLSPPVLERLRDGGTRIVALRCSGFNNVDLGVAEKLGIAVARVPAYSPHAVAEHTVGLILALERKIPKAFNRVREGNFALDGLLGRELHGRTAGIIGTGKIGTIVLRILAGFGCRLLAYDIYRSSEAEALGARYVDLEELCRQSDVISLHCPLVPGTYRIINEDSVGWMKRGVTLINTSRGKLIDTGAVVRALKSGQIGALGLDVYEEEADLFFEDLSSEVIQDDVFARMLTFPNVVITGHQAFFTQSALQAIARTTFENLRAFERGQTPPGLVTPELVRA
ncbi:MAG: 2-hydroxyacid dehydrogenase [Planctomycetota bacterium]